MNGILNKAIAFIVTLVIGISIAESPATPTDLDYIFGPLEIVADIEDGETEPEPYVYIEIVEPHGIIHIGDEIVLKCVVVGLDGQEYRIQWQYSEDLEEEHYQDLDCTEEKYRFIATYENVGYYYRVHIITD